MNCKAASLIQMICRSHYPATKLASAVFIAAMAISSNCLAQDDAVRGEKLYQENCMVCHSLDKNQIGPMHRGVFGRRAASVFNYEYSEPLKKSGIVWNGETLDKWLTDPQTVVPDNKMFFSIDDAQDRSDLIAFLREKAK
jgi:cytochrome c